MLVTGSVDSLRQGKIIYKVDVTCGVSILEQQEIRPEAGVEISLPTEFVSRRRAGKHHAYSIAQAETEGPGLSFLVHGCGQRSWVRPLKATVFWRISHWASLES